MNVGRHDFARASLAPATEIVPLSQATATLAGEWIALAAEASAPNSFAEHWFVAASVAALPTGDVRMVVVREQGTLIGLMPIVVARRYGRMSVAHVENWLHYNSFFGAPLVRRGCEHAFWQGLLGALDTDRDSPSFLHVVALDADDAITRALIGARPATAIVHWIERAMLASDMSPTAYYEATVRKKKRKEIGRLQSRLRELGEVSFRHLRSADELPDWTDCFLSLEASGWKGRGGSALANTGATADLLRRSLAGALAAGKLDMLRLDLDGRAIAMLVNFLAPPGSFSFKIAFDEDYARFSPGVLIQLKSLAILDRAEIDWTDSCAAPDHPMINSLWGERRAIVRVTVPLKGWQRRATFSLCRALENLSARVRAA